MRRFIECLLPLTQCNLKCSYCYIIQQKRRSNLPTTLNYPIDVMVKALSCERLGGVSLISITASGETLLSRELPDLVAGLLKEGHFVNVTTNGSLTKQLTKLLESIKGYESHMHLSFSLHYVELLKQNLIDTFFRNIISARKAGCSVLCQFNLVDEYIPYLDEIKSLSKKYLGSLPQVALTRDESTRPFSIQSKLSKDEYYQIGSQFESPLFDMTTSMFNQKRKEYCCAGYWSGKLNLSTGIMTGCYGLGIHQNIFDDISAPIKWRPVGFCQHPYCINSSHFLSQGIIPELRNIPSYGTLRKRTCALDSIIATVISDNYKSTYSPEMDLFLQGKFINTNPWSPLVRNYFICCAKLNALLWELRNSPLVIAKRTATKLFRKKQLR